MVVLAASPACSPKFLLGTTKSTFRYRRGSTIYSQGDPADAAFYVLAGTITLAIVSHDGKEAVVEVVGASSFFGEDCLGEAARRSCSAVPLDGCTLLRVEKSDLLSALRRSPEFTDAFLNHLLVRSARMREEFAEHLFSPSEHRLVRVLLMLAEQARNGDDLVRIPRVSQTTLASMVGTTRSRISFFLGRFRRMGMIDYDHGVRVNWPLMNATLRQDLPVTEPESRAS